MSVLARRHRTRILMLSLLVVLLAAATAVVGGRQSAQAFDCMSVEPKPTSCPFLKIDQESTKYVARADLLAANGGVLHSWREEGQDGYTLWHWRWRGAQDRVRLVVIPTRGNRTPRTFEFPARETHCYLVNGSGVFPVTGCDDSADPPDSQ